MTMSTPHSAADGLRRLIAEAIGTQEVVAASLGLNPTDLRCLELAAGEETAPPGAISERDARVARQVLLVVLRDLDPGR